MRLQKYPTFLDDHKGVSGEKVLLFPVLLLTIIFKTLTACAYYTLRSFAILF
jgi:hypothetical protein